MGNSRDHARLWLSIRNSHLRCHVYVIYFFFQKRLILFLSAVIYMQLHIEDKKQTIACMACTFQLTPHLIRILITFV